MNQTDTIWRSLEFRHYLGSTAFSGIAFAMQQLLLAWILIGILELPATRVGIIQAVVGIPGIFLMLLGGAKADGIDPRSLLIQVYSVAPLLPLFLIVIINFELLSIWSVLVWGLGMSVVVSYSSPAQQAILNRVASSEVQKAVSAATAIGFMVQILGLGVAGTMDALGLIPVLSFQALCVGLGAFAVRRLNPRTPTQTSTEPALRNIVAGLNAVYRHKVILQTLVINFVSSIFNAGAFMTVFPFIIKRIYEGDALLLSMMMIIFYGGATASNFIMIRLMPLLRPGRIYLLMQFSRMLILGLMWIQPNFWLFAVATVGWGLNMGVTLTLARTIVQESASEEYRARVMSVYSLGLLGSAPIGALLLGWIIESFGTLNALLPAMCISVILFAYGVLCSDVYSYESPRDKHI
ncbi:MAG: MFS transporter [Gammaproteobacteria bacterium]|nr:MFS transporter [Gammaproteobacteria bacterium]